jgi:hypothetical protein
MNTRPPTWALTHIHNGMPRATVDALLATLPDNFRPAERPKTKAIAISCIHAAQRGYRNTPANSRSSFAIEFTGISATECNAFLRSLPRPALAGDGT